MKTVLCYGDSNTYGYIPGIDAGRYDHKTRWPMVLKRLLNEGCPPDDPAYWVEEEGQNGRTTTREDPIEGDKNGFRQLIPILESHHPIDIVVIMLGTNDLKPRFSPTAPDIALGVQRLVEAVKLSGFGPDKSAPKVLVICPPPIIDNPGNPVFKHMIEGGEAISKELPYWFDKLVAGECGVPVIDAGKIIASSQGDGIHFDPEEHTKLATAVAGAIRKL
ncbi:MAG: SGNH/GDSL hydrolase family protein [Treponema sp.]|jgi:lysophospholipase L1-like esterase|nr:SGNH/GDSL hydrolase family protein [Treponema sp.]